MAQALYDQHPLDEYLKESGDNRERLPGTFTDTSDGEDENASVGEDCLDFVIRYSSLQVLEQWVSVIRSLFISQSDDFAERFKYDLISSNLLSSSVAPPFPMHSYSRPSTPDRCFPGELKTSQHDASSKNGRDLRPLSSAFIVFGLVALLSRHRMTALLALLMSIPFAKAPGVGSTRKSYIPQMFEALDNLKLAGSAWDAAVNDAITTIEREERSSFYSSSSSALPSPASALRVTLHSTLLTTQQQCDNVRPLLAALASPMELSQLSEMYAPPSPSKPTFTLQTRPSSPRHKPASLSENNIHGPSQSPLSSAEKRRTWNGSYASIARRSSRATPPLKKRDWRRSDLSVFSDAQNTSSATPISSPRSPSLLQVLEEEGADQDQFHEKPSSDSVRESNPAQEVFGAAALSLRRRRRVSGADVLGLSNALSAPSLRDSVHLSCSPGTSSRLTSLSSTRHPLSLNALHHALQGALASRRYSCAHLLALRFTEDSEDEAYWENVRSVTGLLTSVLEDATGRLNEALAVADDLKRQDGQPTPESSAEGSPVKTPNDDLPVSTNLSLRDNRLRSLSHVSKPSVLLDLPNLPSPDDTPSFAPVPSGISRFASHVDAISSSLSDAREQLLECVQVLRDAHIPPGPQSPRLETEGIEPSKRAVLQSYERLRKELGYALRECERGKAALLDVFEVQRLRSRPQDELEEMADDESDASSSHVRFHMLSGSSKDSNDKTDADPLTPGDGSPIMPILPTLEVAGGERYVDDATQHLLLSASSSHLPPPGLEQVFESDSVTSGPFNRERSKLSREERIRRMKAKRDSMTGRGLAAHLEEEDVETKATKYKGWGPGTDVVEELKDVIWKVGERRRKMTQMESAAAPPVIPVGTATVAADGATGDHDTNLCSP